MTEKPLSEAYPDTLSTIGDHLWQKRLEAGLLLKEVALRVAVTVDTIINGEFSRRTKPGVRYLPAIIDFLGFVPFPIGTSLLERLQADRMMRGWSRRRLAGELGSTRRRCGRGKRKYANLETIGAGRQFFRCLGCCQRLMNLARPDQ